MSRLLKILIYAVVLFFLFLWVSTIVKSCGSDEETNTANTSTETAGNTQEETYDEDDFFEDESENDEIADDPSDLASEDEDQIDYTEIDQVVEDQFSDQESKPSRPTSTSTSTTTASKGNSNGKYMVIAGSFLIKDYALDMQKRLSKLGYDDSDLVVFDLSQYHSVVASRYSTYEAALKVSNELKRSGVDCYVHAQQF